MAPVLGYWDIRGLTHHIRLLLAYTETPFEDKQYSLGPAPDFDRSAWLNEKFNLGLDFPNLPYYIDDGVKITQSVAILRYLARKHKLDPESEEDKIRADMVEQQTVDLLMKYITLCYNPDFEKLKEDYSKNLPSVLKPLSDFLGKRKWFASQNKLTYVDFMVYELFANLRYFEPDCLNNYQNLKEFMDRFEALPTIRKYMHSADYLEYPFWSDKAFFGARPSKK